MTTVLLFPGRARRAAPRRVRPRSPCLRSASPATSTRRRPYRPKRCSRAVRARCTTRRGSAVRWSRSPTAPDRGRSASVSAIHSSSVIVPPSGRGGRVHREPVEFRHRGGNSPTQLSEPRRGERARPALVHVRRRRGLISYCVVCLLRGRSAPSILWINSRSCGSAASFHCVRNSPIRTSDAGSLRIAFHPSGSFSNSGSIRSAMIRFPTRSYGSARLFSSCLRSHFFPGLVVWRLPRSILVSLRP